MKAEIMMNNKIVFEPETYTELYALSMLLLSHGDKKVSDMIEIENKELWYNED